jgi:hypothetical protein
MLWDLESRLGVLIWSAKIDLDLTYYGKSAPVYGGFVCVSWVLAAEYECAE